jgi:hypothetical protein
MIKSKYIYISAFALIVLFISIQFNKLYKAKSSLTVLEEPIVEYKSLFKDSLEIGITYKNNGRNPISDFLYKSKFPIIVYKMDVKENFSLRSVFANNAHVKRTEGLTYFIVNGNGYDFSFNSDSVDTIDHVYFTVDGEQLVTLFRNDSIVNYLIKYDQFSIKYDKQSCTDIYAKSKGIGSDKNFSNVLFYKKNKLLYFIFLNYPKDEKKWDKNILIKLIK